MNRKSVLVTGVGGIIGQAIIKCLKMANMKKSRSWHYDIIGSDSSYLSAGLYQVDKGVIVPKAKDPKYVQSVTNLIRRYNIKATFIGTDPELEAITKDKIAIEKETGVKILTSPPEVIEIARDKWKTFEFLRNKGFTCPDSALPVNLEKFMSTHGFPVVVKPREGYGSVGYCISHNSIELEHSIASIEKIGWQPIIQEYLGPKDEFTTGVCIDQLGKDVISSISIRKILKNGQTYKAFIDDFSDVKTLSERIALALGAVGAVNIQSKISKGANKVFEINPRLSATCAMRAAAGINEPDLLFRNFVLDESVKVGNYEKLVCMRYWEEVYLEKEKYVKNLANWNIGKNDKSF